MLRWLTGAIISGNGSRPNDDIEKVTGRPPTTFSRLRPAERPRLDLPGGRVTMPVDDVADFAALDPFFQIIGEGLAGLVDGEHFFDLLAEDVIFEFVISVPGYPRRVEGRQAVLPSRLRRRHGPAQRGRAGRPPGSRDIGGRARVCGARAGGRHRAALRQPLRLRDHRQGP